jgi:RNA polymerase sigma-70 factor (ECF subfamily)
MTSGGAACDTARLYRDYAREVGRWATRLSGSPADADDIVQEVFLTVHRQRGLGDPLRSPPAWLLEITRNVVRHVWRSRSRAARRASALARDSQVAAAPDPLEQLERRRMTVALQRALDGLDDRYREIYWLSDVQRLPSAQVASLTGLSPEALRVRRFRARRQLARELAPHAPA